MHNTEKGEFLAACADVLSLPNSSVEFACPPLTIILFSIGGLIVN